MEGAAPVLRRDRTDAIYHSAAAAAARANSRGRRELAVREPRRRSDHFHVFHVWPAGLPAAPIPTGARNRSRSGSSMAQLRQRRRRSLVRLVLGRRRRPCERAPAPNDEKKAKTSNLSARTMMNLRRRFRSGRRLNLPHDDASSMCESGGAHNDGRRLVLLLSRIHLCRRCRHNNDHHDNNNSNAGNGHDDAAAAAADRGSNSVGGNSIDCLAELGASSFGWRRRGRCWRDSCLLFRDLSRSSTRTARARARTHRQRAAGGRREQRQQTIRI